MRENIGLFRGKRIDNGEWVEGFYCTYKFDNVMPVASRHYIMPLWTNAPTEVIPDTVGECTGLKDKNGKLIFEGDIVQYYGTYPLEVFIENGHAKIRWIDTVENVECVEMFLGYDEETCRECEIIGNIHDNGELMKEGADNG